MNHQTDDTLKTSDLQYKYVRTLFDSNTKCPGSGFDTRATYNHPYDVPSFPPQKGNKDTSTRT